MENTREAPRPDRGGNVRDNDLSGCRNHPLRVPDAGVRIEGIGVRLLADGRRLDVAVDLGPFPSSGSKQTSPGDVPCPRLELAVESPTGRHVCSVSLIECRTRAVDLVMHLHGHPEPGEYRLHAGLFWEEALLHHEQRTFSLPSVMTQA